MLTVSKTLYSQSSILTFQLLLAPSMVIWLRLQSFDLLWICCPDLLDNLYSKFKRDLEQIGLVECEHYARC